MAGGEGPGGNRVARWLWPRQNNSNPALNHPHIRIVSNSGYRDHTGPLFNKLGILPLEELIKYSQLRFMHDYFHGRLPLSFNEIWIQNRNRNPDLALRNANNLYVPAHHFATTKRFPLYTFPKIWNDAVDIKYNPSKRTFLKSVKSALLNIINV